ncbi:MAG: M20 family metallopeptidase [Theionarchaea archaeon]|nr:M20 family metallopeptidase [Theionarchaea archaeon]MBU7037208.1 M20 family metallopeptidase [Theionarchaea archaeon]
MHAVKDEIIEFTEQLIRIPTVNPPGDCYKECVAFLKKKCDELGLETTVDTCDGLPSIIGGDGKGVLHFHGHYDVVGGNKSQFTPVVREGKLYGRGSSDMKGGLAAMLYAISEVQHPNISFSITPDEETGGLHGFACLLDKGLISPKAVIMPEVSSNTIWNACRGALAVELAIKGRSAHSVFPQQGSNAFEAMVDTAETFREIDPGRGTVLLGGSVRGGTQFNMVPESCSFSVDWRFPSSQSLDDIRNSICSLIDTMRKKGVTIESETLLESEGFLTPEDAEICTWVADAVKEVKGSVQFAECPGFLDIRHCAHRGIPAVAYGPGLLEVAHGPDEYVMVSDIVDAFSTYCLVGKRAVQQI